MRRTGYCTVSSFFRIYQKVVAEGSVMIKQLIEILIRALIGFVAGSLTTLVLSFLWLKLFPIIDRTGQGSGLPLALLFILAILSPVSIIGGLIGGAIPKEGGRKDQLTYAAIISSFLTIPFALFVLWFTGF
jgi:hypothetical protein